MVLLASLFTDLQLLLEWCTMEDEAIGMWISTSKTEAVVLSQKRMACSLQAGWEVLYQVVEFKYFGVLFISEGRIKREIDR